MTAEGFRDRLDAGRTLAEQVRGRVEPPVVVLGLPRGGVPVAAEVATALQAALDVFVVRKVGTPGQPELAMGAVASGGVTVRNEPVLRAAGVSSEEFERACRREQSELAQRERRYRGERSLEPVAGRSVVVVDDGLATGSTMRAAVTALRRLHPARLVVAVPVGAAETCAELASEVDDLVCSLTPAPFLAVGSHYERFEPVRDEAVVSLLAGR